MEVFSALLPTLEHVFSTVNLTFLIGGTLIGFVLGILPGLAGVNGVLMVLPFTFGMDPGTAMLLFAGMMGGSAIGGSLTAILLRVPGDATNAAAVFDGYPMAMRGEAGRAISVSAFSSLFAATLSLILFALLIPIARQIILLLGPPELFMLVMTGLVAVAFASPGNFLKGIVGAGLGMLISFVGFSAALGSTRFMFGTKEYLWDGVEITTILLGMLAISQMIEFMVERRVTVAEAEIAKVHFKGIFHGIRDIWTFRRTFAQSTLIGFIIGLVPAVGGVLANILSYVTAMRTSKTPELFGTGTPEGLIASEAAISSKDGGALFPTVAFGIPGSAEMAVLLGAFIFHGLQPGPLFIQEHTDIVWFLAYGFLIANIIAAVVSIFLSPLTSAITRLNLGYVIPLIIIATLTGVFTTRGIIWDVLLCILFGIFGYFLRRHGYPYICVVLGFALGPLAEKFYFQSLGINFGSPMIFVQRPIALCIGIIAIVMLTWPILKNLRSRSKASRLGGEM